MARSSAHRLLSYDASMEGPRIGCRVLKWMGAAICLGTIVLFVFGLRRAVAGRIAVDAADSVLGYAVVGHTLGVAVGATCLQPAPVTIN